MPFRSAATAAVLVLAGCSGGGPASSAPRARTNVADPVRRSVTVSHGPAIGDVAHASALAWIRASGPGTVHLQLEPVRTPAEGVPPTSTFRRTSLFAWESRAVDANTDFAATFTLTGLQPGVRYRVRTAMEEDSLQGDAAAEATFRTAPRPSDAVSIRFAFGGDIGGQNVCRDAERGYPVFDAIADLHPDFFLVLGDMIYADTPCAAIGRYGNRQVPGPVAPATDLEGFRARWRYNRADAHFARLLRSVPMVVTWDDHEVRNDVGPHRDTHEGVHLMPLGLRALLEHNPVRPPPDAPNRLYRSLRWGAHVELIVLDTRQYRSPNDAPDGPDKTMLGEAQLAWFAGVLGEPAATWTVVATSVPLSLATGSDMVRDGWSGYETETGFGHELESLFQMLLAGGRRNVLFVTADTHYAAGFRYRPLEEAPAWVVHEVVASPLHSGVGSNPEFDPHFGAERLFYYAHPDPEGINDIVTAMKFMNFGVVEIDEAGDLSATVRGVDGRVIERLDLPRAPPDDDG